jgi:hypothetical protein
VRRHERTNLVWLTTRPGRLAHEVHLRRHERTNLVWLTTRPGRLAHEVQVRRHEPTNLVRIAADLVREPPEVRHWLAVDLAAVEELFT